MCRARTLGGGEKAGTGGQAATAGVLAGSVAEGARVVSAVAHARTVLARLVAPAPTT